MGDRMGAWVRVALIGVVVAGAAACGKPMGPRGFTKAPLDVPGPFVKREPETEMSRLGVKPNLPPVVDLQLKDSTQAK